VQVCSVIAGSQALSGKMHTKKSYQLLLEAGAAARFFCLQVTKTIKSSYYVAACLASSIVGAASFRDCIAAPPAQRWMVT